MHTLWAVMRTEMRLAWRRPTYWVVLVLWLVPLGFALIANMSSVVTFAPLQYFSEHVGTQFMTWLLLLPLIIGPALTRDLGNAGELLWATPLDALTHLAGVAGGLLLALLPALLAQLAAQWLVAAVLLGLPAANLFWRYEPPLLLATTVAAVSVAVVLALLLRRTLLLLLAWVALWALTLQAVSGYSRTTQAMALASPANLFYLGLQLSPSLGLGAARPLVQGLALWFVGLGVLGTLLAIGVALIADRRRAMRVGLLLVTWVVLAIPLAGGGFLLHARAVRAQTIPSSPADIQSDAWQVQAHTLDVSVDAAHDTLTGSSTLRLVPSAPIREAEVVLRLNPGLTITEARDEAGQALAWRRVGDSIVIALPGPSAEPLTLQLRWQGSLLLPFNDYRELGGYRYPAFDTPQPVRALLSDGVGYFFRDGDWYPWPWGNRPGPQQAEQNRVTLRVSDKRALASAPLDNGVVTWDGELPAVLLVLPPSGSRTVNNRTLYFGSLGDIENLLLRSTLIVIPGEPENQLSRPTESGSGDSENQLSRPTESGSLGGAEDVYVRRLEELAALAPQVAVALGAETAPTSIVAVPYLDEIVWSGDLLLVGDGTSFVSEENGDVLFHSDSAELDATIQERTLMAALSRAWLDDHMVIATGWLRVRPDQLGVIAYTGMPGETDIVWLPGVADHPQGRWIRSQGPIADLAPVLSSPEGRQQLLVGGGEDQRRMPSMADIQRLGVEEQLDLVALWLAVELADSAAREADLAVLLAPPDPSPSSDKFEPFLLRLLPFDFPVGQAQKAALIWALHDWLEEAGREQALRLVGEAVREQSDAFNLESLLAELEQRSGVAIEYEESE